MRVKEAGELSGSSLQSPNDWEATYRTKGGEGHRGYVVNLSETCDRENPVQLITQVAVAPNVGDDSVLLAEALPKLEVRTGVETLITDGGYESSANDGLLAAHRGALVQTAFRGCGGDGERFSLEAFCLSCADGSGVPKAVVCPAGVSGSVGSLSSGKGWWVAFGTGCAGCALRGRCPVVERKRLGGYGLRLTAEAIGRAVRRRLSCGYGELARNLRAGVESAVRSVKRPFAGGKASVRGRFRVACLVVGSAAVVSVRRLHRLVRGGGGSPVCGGQGVVGANGLGEVGLLV